MLAPLRTAATRASGLPRAAALRAGAVTTANKQPPAHVRFVNTQGEELGGVQGSEPPSPKKNPVNWKAGSYTLVGVLLAGWWMYRAKESAKEAASE